MVNEERLKKNDINAWVRWLIAIILGMITMLSIAYSIGSKVQMLQMFIKQTSKEVQTMKAEGSSVAKQNEKVIIAMEKDISSIQQTTKDMKTQMDKQDIKMDLLLKKLDVTQ